MRKMCQLILTKSNVCAKKGDGTIPEWNTTIAEGTVLEGLEATDEVVARNPDIIEQILTRLDNVTEIPQEKVTEAVSEYMKGNPPQTLTIKYGNKTHTYDGSEAVAITIETGGIERIEKLATDTAVTLEPNKLYIFPEMASLTYTLAEPADESCSAFIGRGNPNEMNTGKIFFKTMWGVNIMIKGTSARLYAR